MVKGNGDRRRELAERRKLESVQEKERKSLGPEFSTPAEARARLLSDAAALGSEEGLVGWVTASDGPSICEEFFRTGLCALRRCRYAHTVSISALSGVPPTPGPIISKTKVPVAGEAEVQRTSRRSRASARAAVEQAASGGIDASPTRESLPPLTSMPLRAVDPGGGFAYDRTVRTHVRAEWKLHFIEWGGRLVFDAANPSVFAGYCEIMRVAAVAAAAAAVKDVPGNVAPTHAPDNISGTVATDSSADDVDGVATELSAAVLQSDAPHENAPS